MNKEAQFYHDLLPGKESHMTIFSRIKEGVESALDKSKGKTLPVIVSRSQSMKIRLKGLQKFGQDVPREFFKGTKYCEIIVMVLKTDGVFKALDRILVNLTV